MNTEINNFYLGEYNDESKKYDNYENTLLLVIDLQEKLMPAIFENEDIVKNSRALLETCDFLNIKKIATEQYPKGLGRSVEPILEKIGEDNIFSKTSFNAVTDEVKKYLEDNEIKKVIVTGAETHICVYQTIRELISLGYEVFLVEDGVSSFNLEQKNLGIRAIESLGARIVNTEMVMFDLMNDSKNDYFKTISKMVKALRL